MKETLKIDKDLAIKAFRILLARSDGTPAGILQEFHKAFVEFKQLSNQDFKEAEHPRDEAGKFTDKGAKTSTTGTTTSSSEEKIKDGINKFKSDVGVYGGNKKVYFKKFSKWFKKNISGETKPNPKLGTIYFYARGLEETLYHNWHTPDNLQYFPAIFKIIEQSENITQEPLKHPKQGIKCAYRIIKEFTDKQVEIVILEDSEGKKKFYTFYVRNKK